MNQEPLIVYILYLSFFHLFFSLFWVTPTILLTFQDFRSVLTSFYLSRVNALFTCAPDLFLTDITITKLSAFIFSYFPEMT